MTSLSSRPTPVFPRLLALIAILFGLAVPRLVHAATDDAGPAAQILPSDPPRLELRLPVPAGSGPAPAMIAVDIEQGLVASGALDAELPGGVRFRRLPAAGRITLDAAGAAGWSVFQARPAARRTLRLVIANQDLTLSGSTPSAASPAAPLRLVLPLADAGKPLAVTVRTGTSLASLGPPQRLAVAVPAIRDQVVFRALGGQALTALDIGDRITLAWNARDCISATLSGPLDYGNAVQTLARGPDGTCEGTRTIVVMGPATFVLKALVPEKPGSAGNLLVERAITVDVRRLEQFASLLVTPAAVLPGGEVTVRWHLRDLAGGDRRSAVLAWTDMSGNDRVQRLPLVKGETNSGSFSFAASSRPTGSRAGVVRLLYGAEAIERDFDIVQWQPRTGGFGDGPGSPPRRGMVHAGGHLLVCTEKGIFGAPAAGAIANGVGIDSDPFPSLTRLPLREVDPLPPPGAPAPAGGSERRDLAGEPCYAMIALNAREALAILRIDPGPGGSRPETDYAELVVLRPAQGLAGKPLTLTEDPIAVAADNVRDYQLARLGTRLYIRVLIGGSGGGSLVRAFSIDLAAAAANRQSWRREELLESATLPGGRWRLIDGFGEDGKAMLAVSDASGALYRFTALDVPKATGTLDFPRAGQTLDPARLPALRDGVLVNVQGVLVALGADVTYNPQTNAWTAGATGITGLAGGVVAYRGDAEPRLWAVRRDGERLTLAVAGPRLFSRDYFDQGQDTSLDVLSRRTSLRVLAPAELAWRSEPPGRVVTREIKPAAYGCAAAPGGRLQGVEAIVEIDHDERPPTIFGKAAAIDVVLRRAEDGSWRSVSSNDCVSVRATTATVP